MGELPATSVGGGYPVHELRQVSIGMRGNHQMPVVRHKAVREKCDLSLSKSFMKYFLKRQIVAIAGEDRRALGRAIHDMKEQARCRMAPPARHDTAHRKTPAAKAFASSINDSRPHLTGK
jgi:hypothetical protein